MPRLGSFAAGLVLLTVPAIGTIGQPVEPDRILLPVATDQEWEGGYGSRWVSRLWVVNASTDPVQIVTDCQVLCPPLFSLPGKPIPGPGGVAYSSYPETPGVFLMVEPGGAEKIRVSLRIQDVSRQALTWGTEVPVVRLSRFSSEVIHLVDIPLDQRFRQALRIYSMSTVPVQARVRIIPLTPPQPGGDAPVVDEVVELSAGSFVHPGYAQRIDFASLWPQLAACTAARIEIEPLDPEARLWAFVSTTNNETQHVTLSTPRD